MRYSRVPVHPTGTQVVPPSAAGSVLYKVLWEGYPPECGTWEEERVIPDSLIDDYEAGLDAGEELEGADGDSDGDESDDEGEV